MDAYTIIRETMDEFKDVPEEKVRVFISLAEPLISKRLSKEDGEYSLTTYGSMYLTLRNRVTIPIICGGETTVNG